MANSTSSLVHVRDVPRVEAPSAPTPTRRLAEVRLYDRLAWPLQASISLAALVLLSPVFLLVAAVIKLTSPGPVFYRGDRVGQGMRAFKIYKFRTLAVGAEGLIGARLLSHDDKYAYCSRIGRLLKRTKLDELPQLLNVIKGDMRLVGPRPVRPVFLERHRAEIRNYALRFLVPPGITGIAQLRGGYYTSPANKLRYELVYIRNRSLLLDLWVVLLTFIKILNRWLSVGLFVIFLFLCVSFVPTELQPVLRLPSLGLRITAVSLLVVALAAWVFVKRGPAEFSLYRSPLNLPMLFFVLLNVGSALFSDDPFRALRGSTYYVVTGFLTAFVIVNSLATRSFMAWTIRTIAVTSAVISLFGLFQTFTVNVSVASAAAAAPGLLAEQRASSVLGNPVVLAVYLVLGIPLLLSLVTLARSQRERDFWLVCSTISFVGVFLTQTRVGLLALLVTGVVFLARRRAHALAFFAVFVLCVLLMVSLGAPRFSLATMQAEVAAWAEEKAHFFWLSPKEWLVGTGEVMTPERLETSPAPPGTPRRPTMSNMHLTLILEHGILGWAMVMWLVLSTVATLKAAHDRTRDDELKTLLWAIVSSILGYLVSMHSMNTFHHLPVQILFWSLIGIGLGIATHLGRHRRRNLIWRFGDAGD